MGEGPKPVVEEGGPGPSGALRHLPRAGRITVRLCRTSLCLAGEVAGRQLVAVAVGLELGLLF